MDVYSKVFADMLVLCHTWTFSDCDACVHKTYTRSREPKAQHGWENGSWSPTPSWGASFRHLMASEVGRVTFLQGFNSSEALDPIVHGPMPIHMQAVLSGLNGFLYEKWRGKKWHYRKGTGKRKVVNLGFQISHSQFWQPTSGQQRLSSLLFRVKHLRIV